MSFHSSDYIFALLGVKVNQQIDNALIQLGSLGEGSGADDGLVFVFEMLLDSAIVTDCNDVFSEHFGR